MTPRRLAWLGVIAATVAALALLWWKTGKEAEHPAAVAGKAGPAAADRPPSGDGAGPGKVRQGGQAGTTGGLGSTQTPVSSPRPRAPHRSIKGGAIKGGAIGRPPAELDTADLVRPPDQSLEGQEIPVAYAPYVNLAYEAYRASDFEGARKIALKVLSELKGNVSLQRTVVASSCRLGDKETAAAHIGGLPAYDAEEMKKLCKDLGQVPQ